ncbi:hypothetical protein ABVT39_007044 [Epinephelus coioides]
MNMPLCHHLLFWQVQQRERHQSSPDARIHHICHICSILMGSKPCSALSYFIKLKQKKGLTCVEECDSKSLCSPCAMQYHDYTKDSLLTSWLPPLAHTENDQRCKPLHNHIFNAEASPTRLSGMLPLLLQGAEALQELLNLSQQTEKVPVLQKKQFRSYPCPKQGVMKVLKKDMKTK